MTDELVEPKVALDACVLYPAPIRDLLLSIAALDIFTPKWSEIIQNEWVRNLLVNREDIKKKSLDKTVKAMNKAFPKANARNFEHLIETLKLPDLDYRHILATAIKTQSNLITTFNIKDFPSNYLAKFNIKAIHPDDFILSLINENPTGVFEAFENQVYSLKTHPFLGRKY